MLVWVVVVVLWSVEPVGLLGLVLEPALGLLLVLVLGLVLELELVPALGRCQVPEGRWREQLRSWVVSVEVNNLLRRKVQ